MATCKGLEKSKRCAMRNNKRGVIGAFRLTVVPE